MSAAKSARQDRRGEVPGPIVGGTGTGATPSVRRRVELSFSADSRQLYQAWQAMANLADMAGKIQVTVHAENEQGFDQGKLNNGVMQPLQEADLID